MVMMTLLVCLASDPTVCKSLSMPVEGGPQACVLGGQIQAADWVGSHPDWRVARVTCGRREVRT